MRIRSTHPMWKAAFTLISILLVIVIVMLTVFTTHRPRTLWHIMASIYMPPPAASTIAGGFTTLPPGSVLPSEKDCAARIHRSTWEPRPDNTTANHSVPTLQQIAQLSPWDLLSVLTQRRMTCGSRLLEILLAQRMRYSSGLRASGE